MRHHRPLHRGLGHPTGRNFLTDLGRRAYAETRRTTFFQVTTATRIPQAAVFADPCPSVTPPRGPVTAEDALIRGTEVLLHPRLDPVEQIGRTRDGLGEGAEQAFIAAH